MKIIKIILLFFLSEKIAYSQKKVEFHYRMNEKINNLTEQPIWGMEQEFNTQRIYYSTFLFSETRLFTGDNRRNIFFKIKNDVWYYKLGSKWKLFYDSKRKIGGFFSVMKVKYNINFKKEVNIGGISLHKIVLKPLSLIQSHSVEYYFNRQKGVLIIKSGSVILLRTDSFQKPLNDTEIDLL